MQVEPRDSPWIVRAIPRPRASVRLVCFPFAGGSAQLYATWAQRLPAHIEVLAVELPGRGRRFGQRLVDDWSTLLDELMRGVTPYLVDKPFAFFGYSLGARIAFALAHRIKAQAGAEPRTLFAAAAPGPHLAYRHPISHLPRTSLVAQLRELGGTPEEVLGSEELLALMLPIVRADFRLVESFPTHWRERLACPFVALAGGRDPRTTAEEVDAWREHTNGPFERHTFEGEGHFFLAPCGERILDLVTNALREDG